MTLKVKWIDSHREPQNPSNPQYPQGIDVDCASGDGRTCSTLLPYPAKRCGVYVIRCSECGLSVVLTTAGRPDDPKSVKVTCK